MSFGLFLIILNVLSGIANFYTGVVFGSKRNYVISLANALIAAHLIKVTYGA